MAIRNVVKDGDPVLKKVCRPVTSFDERLAILLEDMGETMLENDGLGLAGPQVGVMRRVFVAMDESKLPPAVDKPDDELTDEELAQLDAWEPEILEFINPEVIEQEGEVRGYEGCLSFPGRFGAIARPARVKVRAQDRSGQPFEFEATGMLARCLCHETNHLDGITIEDLAEYFFDPEVPHDLDETITGKKSEDAPEDKEGEA